jgi:hypothetical protein
MQGNQTLQFTICDADQNTATVGANVNYNEWTHVAAVLDGFAGTINLYTNGLLAAQLATSIRPFGPLVSGSSPGVGIGNLNDGGNNFPFVGDIDEVALYGRALSTNEIAAIYHAGSAGKCTDNLPPSIATPPQGQTVSAGAGVTLTVGAVGTGPFSYQWTFNGTNIAGATNATLSLSNLHVFQSGNYAVKITTPYGNVTSGNALVTVSAQNILLYNYSGSEKITTLGNEFSYNYNGEMIFVPDTTNAVFIGWATLNNKKQFWVSPVPDYLLVKIPGSNSRVYTLLGKVDTEFDGNGQPHIWSYLHKGQNAPLQIAAKKYFSFPGTFSCNNTHIYPDAKTGNLILREATSAYTFMTANTQTANNTAQTVADVIAAQVKTLVKQGYTAQ